VVLNKLISANVDGHFEYFFPSAALNHAGSRSRTQPPAPAKPRKAFAPPPAVPVGAVPDGKVVDFLTGQYVNDTPEEYVRQNIEKALVRQYKYAPNDCRPEFRIGMGSAKPRVDIVVFPAGEKHEQANAYILVETKKAETSPQDKKDGIGQLQSYLAACANAKYGLWTNGDERFCYAKRIKGGRIVFDEIVDIPSVGQTEAEAARPKRTDLMPATADNLLFAFRRCHNYIAGTEGMQKPEAFWELLKLIFCKIEDERSRVLEFFVAPAELAGSTAAAGAKGRIAKLFTEKVVKKYPKIFTGADRDLQLKPNVLAYVVSQLQRYSLLASPVDVKGVAYEEIVGSNLRGDRGEFFTPRNACRMAVAMLAPQPDERLLDPAGGTGGFLITAMNHSLRSLEDSERSTWANPSKPTEAERQELYRKRSEYLTRRVFGFDLNPSLVRAAKMNMVMNNDGEGGLFQVNSLSNPHTWNPEASAAVPLGSIDVLFTNPPFGANIVIDDEQILDQYDLAAVWDEQTDGTWTIRLDKKGSKVLQKSQPPEILFIERCVQFLVPGTGRMAMVIPNGILNNPALGYVRHWLLQRTQILGVVDMARDLFQPKNDTQTSIVLMRRLSSDEERIASTSGLSYPIFMAVAEKIGHDKRGNTIFRRTPDGKDLVVARKETVVEIDEDSGGEVFKEVEVRDRIIDDELPEVADAYASWLEEIR
jgi:type I restriction enzyme M protein